MPKALVLDPDVSHGNNVRNYFLDTLALRGVSGWTCDVYPYVGSGVVKAVNEGYALVIRSYSGIWDVKDLWDDLLDQGIQTVHGHGSNDLVLLANPPRLFSAVVVGGEDPADGLEDDRSYGPGLELDSITHDGATEESIATPTVAAILADFYDQTGSWYDARAKLRMACFGYEDGWSPERGFGVVLHDAAMPAGLDLQPPLDIQASAAAEAVSMSWRNFETTNWTRTIVTVDGTPVYQGTGTSAMWTAPASGTYAIAFYSEDAGGQRSRLESFALVTLAITVPDAPAEGSISLVATRAPDYASAVLEASEVQGATLYEVWRGHSLYSDLTLVATTDDPSSILDEDLDPSRPYVYEVRADAPGGGLVSERAIVPAQRSTRLRVPPAVLV